MKEFRLPDPGEGLVEADIVRWVVTEGDEVKVNDILVEIETAKSIVELPSPWAGRIARLMVDEGATVEVGAPIVLIDDGVAAPETPAETPDPVVEPAETPGGSEAFLVGYGVKSSSLARRPRKSGAAIGKPIGPVTDQVHDSYAADQPVSRPIDQATTTGPLSAEAQRRAAAASGTDAQVGVGVQAGAGQAAGAPAGPRPRPRPGRRRRHRPRRHHHRRRRDRGRGGGARW